MCFIGFWIDFRYVFFLVGLDFVLIVYLINCSMCLFVVEEFFDIGEF